MIHLRLHAVTLLAALACVVAVAGPARAEADGPDFYAVTGVAADDVLNIRAAPSTGAARLGEIPPDGHGIKNLGCRGGPGFAVWERMSEAQRRQAAQRRWCRIRYGDVEGWVAGRFLKEDDRSGG